MNALAPTSARATRSAARRNPILHATTLALVMATIPLVAQAQASRDTLRAQAGGETVTVIQPERGKASLVSLSAGRRALSLPPKAYLSSLVATEDHWFAAGVDETAEQPRLLVLKGTGGRTVEVAAPSTTSSLLVNAVVVGDDDSLLALLWLEGERFDTMAVRAARYGANGFAEAETIAPPGPGTQIALSAVQLTDGSLLAAWSAYDGEDDEILWSRTTRRGWSAAARVEEDDAVPDVTPSLTATQDGAWLTWSSYDGNDYRVRLARFEGGTWAPTQTIGEKGSVLPTFAGETERPMVIYKTAVPRTWTVVALGSDGGPQAKGSLPLRTDRRPLVERTADGGLTVRWPALENDASPTAKRAIRIDMAPIGPGPQ